MSASIIALASLGCTYAKLCGSASVQQAGPERARGGAMLHSLSWLTQLLTFVGGMNSVYCTARCGYGCLTNGLWLWRSAGAGGAAAQMLVLALLAWEQRRTLVSHASSDKDASHVAPHGPGILVAGGWLSQEERDMLSCSIGIAKALTFTTLTLLQFRWVFFAPLMLAAVARASASARLRAASLQLYTFSILVFYNYTGGKTAPCSIRRALLTLLVQNRITAHRIYPISIDRIHVVDTAGGKGAELRPQNDARRARLAAGRLAPRRPLDALDGLHHRLRGVRRLSGARRVHGGGRVEAVS